MSNVGQIFMQNAADTASLYNYLTAPAVPLPDQTDVAVIFGRKSEHLAELAGSAVARSALSVVSGEVGKDSGDNPLYGVREDDWLIGHMAAQGVDVSRVLKDPYHPKNGIDNARNMVRIIREEGGLDTVRSMVASIHSTQVRRLGATLARQAEVANLPVDSLVLVRSNYPFDPQNPFDQYEAAFEAMRLDQLSEGSETAFDRPAGLDEFLPNAYTTIDFLDAWLDSQGIKNWSTADGTLRDVAPNDLPALFDEASRQPEV